ncbi:MAG: alpha-galactosidase [Verrucomicrobia bacterium]|nr:alpha-galactosidase [Verrucomicrobiota bacterium]
MNPRKPLAPPPFFQLLICSPPPYLPLMPELAEVEFNRKQWDTGLRHKVLRVELHPGKRVFWRTNLATLTGALTGATYRGSAAHGKRAVPEHTNLMKTTPFTSLMTFPAAFLLPIMVAVHLAQAVSVTPEELDQSRQWCASRFEGAPIRVPTGPALVVLANHDAAESTERRLFSSAPPFSFLYDGKPSLALLAGWPCQREARKLDAQRTEHTLTWSDVKSGLTLRCTAIAYHDFPVVEWTLHFKNTGTTNTPILENIQALDVQLDRGGSGEFLLHHHIGSPADGNDYGPLETTLKPGAAQRISAAGGRPTGSDWSYFNLEWGGHDGLIVVVGWPGQWAADFARDQARGLRIRAGQELTRFRLVPGEEVRSPLVVLQFWQGDWLRAQNIWRRWMMAHSMPRPGGQLPQPQLLASSSRQYDEMIKANETNQIMFINRYLAEGLKLDYWWMDAGWYVHHGGGWPRVGTWQVDPQRFPRGLRAISDHAHSNGVKILVWFEPERVTAGTWLTQNHPEWVLGGAKGGLLDLGHPAARQWLTDHVDQLITEQGIDLYRQDFNMEPLPFWRRNDPPDRQGITEIRHVSGYLAYWDELRRRHPHMLIDSCASGGRRNDLETMRRAVPLWRSDYAYEATGHQCMTYGISLWLPFHGTGTVATRNAPYYGSGLTPVEPYAFWSNVSPSLGCGFDMREKDLDYAALRRLVHQWRQMSVNYYGDFYPLTSWSRDNKLWMAWQFDRPEAGAGLIQAFRRENSFYESARFKLHGLEPGSRYEVTNLDQPQARQSFTGRELVEQGLLVTMPAAPSAMTITYQQAGQK